MFRSQSRRPTRVWDVLEIALPLAIRRCCAAGAAHDTIVGAMELRGRSLPLDWRFVAVRMSRAKEKSDSLLAVTRASLCLPFALDRVVIENALRPGRLMDICESREIHHGPPQRAGRAQPGGRRRPALPSSGSY